MILYPVGIQVCFLSNELNTGIPFSCLKQAYPNRVSLEEPVWTRLSRAYDEGFRAKDETDMHVCLQGTEKRKETYFFSKLSVWVLEG